MGHERYTPVIEYVRSHPGCSSRDIARDVFGGSGATRTAERSKAGSYLRILETMGTVERIRSYNRDPLKSHPPADLWFIKGEAP